jgi:hypothetical protein
MRSLTPGRHEQATLCRGPGAQRPAARAGLPGYGWGGGGRRGAMTGALAAQGGVQATAVVPNTTVAAAKAACYRYRAHRAGCRRQGHRDR